jgi:hypothetical protein
MPHQDDPRDDDRGRRETRRRRDEGDDYDDRPRRRPPEPGVEATDFLIPTNVSGWSMAACYIGLVSCFLPVIGVVIGIVALICGIVALRRRKKAASYGAVTSDIRAVVGMILGSLTVLSHVGFVVYAIVAAQMK